MSGSQNDWTARARAGLNRLMDRVIAFEERGGLGGALARSLERLRAEQERLRQEMSGPGPLTSLMEIRQAYARLEVPFGSDLDTVRRAYRGLMRRYHPDRHARDPERERLATEISQKLTVSYNVLVEYLGR